MKMNRRNFIQLCGGVILATELPDNVWAEVKRPVQILKHLNIKEITIPVGCSKPFSALHISDTHISRVDNRDVERKIKLASKRSKLFPWGEHYFNEAIRYAKEHGMNLFHTGDLIDFVSEANLDFTATHYKTEDWFVAAGNHEYSQFVGEAKEDELYKAESYPKVQEAYPNDLTFCSRIINGVNFVAIDDVYYNITERQHELMELEVRKGLPIFMLCHVPLYTPKHCQYGLEQTKGKAAYMTGAPLEITSKYEHNPNLSPEEQWRNRTVQQKADKPTLDFIAWLKEQKLLKGILCGHCHYFFQEQFSPTAIQYTVGATYQGDAYAVHFI